MQSNTFKENMNQVRYITLRYEDSIKGFTDGAKGAKGGSVTLLGGPMRGAFTTLSPGLMLLFR